MIDSGGPYQRRSTSRVQDPNKHWKPSAFAQMVLQGIGWDLEEQVPARPRCSERDARLLEMIICEDVTLDEVGTHVGLTRERVRQIMVKHTGLSTRDLADYRVPMREILRRTDGVARLYEIIDSDKISSTSELARNTGLTTREVEEVLGIAESLRRKQANTWTSQSVTDDQVLADIKRVAALPGGSPLTGAFYNEHRSEDSIGSVRILQRFGTWREACRRAGVATNEPVRSSYARRWTNEQLLDWATAYVTAAGTRATYQGMTEWLRERADQGAPSSQTIRNEIGGWLCTLELTLTRQQELDAGAESSIAISSQGQLGVPR